MNKSPCRYPAGKCPKSPARARQSNKNSIVLKPAVTWRWPQSGTTHAHAENTAQRQRHNAETQALQAQLNTTEKALQTEVSNGVRLTLELTHAQTQASTAQQQHQAQQERHADEIRLMGERLTTAQTEREQALQAASATREDAAGMRGELEALRVQNAALLATLTPAAPAKDGKDKNKPA